MTSRGSRVLLAHATTVLVLVALFMILDATAGPDEYLVLIYPVFPLFLLGLPWSLTFMSDPDAYGHVGSGLGMLVALGPAALNVVFHGLIRLFWIVTRPVER
ncbi:hypothetical protein ACFOW4_05940 [Micromonospora sp. GCM10011542]|uniref:hypothetical protein n=1 Tax=Micromonospora sp. GCM10011542 TaxID=3317337 RepID=UPI00360A16CB